MATARCGGLGVGQGVGWRKRVTPGKRRFPSGMTSEWGTLQTQIPFGNDKQGMTNEQGTSKRRFPAGMTNKQTRGPLLAEDPEDAGVGFDGEGLDGFDLG